MRERHARKFQALRGRGRPRHMNRETRMLKRSFKLAAVWLAAVPLMYAQQGSIHKDAGKWVQETGGTLAAAKNLRVKVDKGSVKVEGGSEAGIVYVIRNRSAASSEDEARRQFAAYKINSSLRGDTTWLTADWQGGRQQKFSSEFVIRVPRNMEWVKVDTDGGSITATGVIGRVDAQSGGGNVHFDDVGGAIRRRRAAAASSSAMWAATSRCTRVAEAFN